MQMLNKRKTLISISIFLIMAMSTSLTLLPSIDAHTPPWTFDSYAYIIAQPNPVGVGQTIHVVFWIDAPLPGATVANDIRRHDYTLDLRRNCFVNG